jgi:hypothetical protein
MATNYKLQFLLIVAIASIVISLCAFNTYAPVNKEMRTMFMKMDTLSDSIEVSDTISTFDSNDYTEKIVIIKKKVARHPSNDNGEKKRFEDIELSGKTVSKKDTMSTYNPVTKEETLMITSYDIPIELDEAIKTMSAKEVIKYKIKYATNKKNETKAVKRKK